MTAPSAESARPPGAAQTVDHHETLNNMLDSKNELSTKALPQKSMTKLPTKNSMSTVPRDANATSHAMANDLLHKIMPPATKRDHNSHYERAPSDNGTSQPPTIPQEQDNPKYTVHNESVSPSTNNLHWLQTDQCDGAPNESFSDFHAMMQEFHDKIQAIAQASSRDTAMRHQQFKQQCAEHDIAMIALKQQQQQTAMMFVADSMPEQTPTTAPGTTEAQKPNPLTHRTSLHVISDLILDDTRLPTKFVTDHGLATPKLLQLMKSHLDAYFALPEVILTQNIDPG